jgi:hypothetical protein
MGLFGLLETYLGFWQGNAHLALVFPATVFVRHFTNLITLKEQDLGTSFACINFGW